jgi:uncharacterized membrane protein HdeD (DUF308 family)
MQNMTKQTGWIITGVLIVLFGCCGLFSCIGSIATFTNNANLQGQPVQPAAGVIPLCLAVVFIAIPVLSWYFLVRGKDGEAASS